MDALTISKINHDRFGHWIEELTEANCTPVLVVGVSHGLLRGDVHLFTPNLAEDHVLLKVLAIASLELKRRGLWDKVSQVFTEVEPIKKVPAGVKA